MKSRSIYIVGFLFCLFLLSGNADAGPILVTFNTAASFDGGVTFSTSADSGTLSPDTILHFQGGTYNVTLPEPSLEIDQIFGTMWVSKSNSGSIGFANPIDFALQITQNYPNPVSGNPLTLNATVKGNVQGFDSVSLTFDSALSSGTIFSGTANITYSILPVSQSMVFFNTGGSTENLQNIQGHLSDPFTAVPEPTTLALLGTGIFGIGIAVWRRRNQKS